MNTEKEPVRFDFIVIGGGSAGYAAASKASRLGMNTAVIDGGQELGGLCILRGCMPSKTLIESANRNLSARRGSEFGLKVTVGPPDIHAIRDRKRTLIADFAGYRRQQLQDGRFVLHRGRATFQDAHRVLVTPIDGSPPFEISGATFCVSTGSVVNVPDMPGLVETGFWTSDDVLDAAELPATIAILGGGAIALEMAHYLDGVGCKVTLIQRSERFLKNLDPECSDVVRGAYEKRGIRTHCGTHVRRVSGRLGAKVIEFDCHGKIETVEAEEILVATGRNPATASLGLDAAGVAMRKGKITVNDAMQSSQPHIFAAGDVCGDLEVVHIAIQQGEVAAGNAFDLIQGRDVSRRADDRLKLFGVFSHPQVAHVGRTDHELTESGVRFYAASYPFSDHGKSMVLGETEGFVKITAHCETGEILGALCVGPEATEIIHELVVAMQFRCTVSQFAAIPHYHPTLSEIWTYPAEELASRMDRSL